MKVVVFGATGATGRCLVERALAVGHIVTAVARDPMAMTTRHPNHRVVPGDVLDPASVDRAIAGQEAVCWTVGGQDALRSLLARRPRTAGLCTDGTRHVLAAMERHGVRRLLCQSSWGVDDSRGRVPWLFAWIVFPLLLKAELADKGRQEELIRQSTVDWTIVRPTRLTEHAPTGTWRAGMPLEFSMTARVARADVAAFLVQQLTDHTYLRQTVEISS